MDNFCLPLNDKPSVDVILDDHARRQNQLGRELILENLNNLKGCDGWMIDSHMAPIDRRVVDLTEEMLKSSNAEFVVLERDNGSATRDELLGEIDVVRRAWDRAGRWR